MWTILKHTGVLMLLALLSLSAKADEAAKLQRFVTENTDMMVARLEAERDTYYKDPEQFYAAMQDVTESFVDFRRIAARVMGRYARQATPEQRQQFLDKFKRSLFDTYAKALVESKDFKVNVTGVQINERDAARASVDLQVMTASGNRYPVVYSMYRTEAGGWMMENVIVEGVNIGLAFRDRFEQSMEAHRGDIQLAIESWSGKVEELDKVGDSKTESAPGA